MRWPWVNRAEHERQHAELRKATEAAQDLAHAIKRETTMSARLSQEIDAGQRRYESLLDKYHALRLQGAAIPDPKPEPIVRERDEVVDLINATVPPQLRGLAIRQMRADRASGMGDVAIMQQIQAGVTGDIAI